MGERGGGGLRVAVWPGESGGGNPFTDVFAAALREEGCEVVSVQSPAACGAGVDVFHIHWPEQVFWTDGGNAAVWRRVQGALGGLRRLRRGGARVVWMVHNLAPHDMRWKRRLLWGYYLRRLYGQVDGFMTLSPATIAVVERGLPALRGKPSGYGWMPGLARGAGLEGRAGGAVRRYAFVGLLRPYKGVETLIDAFRLLPQPEARLVIAGPPYDAAYAAGLAERARGDGRIALEAGQLSEAAFAARLAAADVVVLPLLDYLHSSSIVHAVSGGAPVLTPDTPFARSVRDAVGGGWVQLYEGSLTAAVLAAARRPDGPARLEAFSAGQLGRAAVAFYRQVLSAGSTSR